MTDLSSNNPHLPPDLPLDCLYVVRGLVRRYGTREVLSGLSFELRRGECLVILGRSGCGKSVCLRQLNGLEPPDAGEIWFDGTAISNLSEVELYPLRRRVAMLFQWGALFDSMNVFENVAFPLREHTDLDARALADTVTRKLALVRLSGIEDRMPAALSGGMRKRVALARSLVLDPEVVLYDEPTTGLDPVTSAAIAELIKSTQHDLGVTSIVVTHDLALARRVGNRLGFLDQGRFRFVGTWDEADHSDDHILTGFLHGRADIEDAA